MYTVMDAGHVFEKKVSSSNGRSGKIPTGIGLYLSKKL